MKPPDHARPDDLAAALGAYVATLSDRAARHLAHVASPDRVFFARVVWRVTGRRADPLDLTPHDIAEAVLTLALRARRAA